MENFLDSIFSKLLKPIEVIFGAIFGFIFSSKITTLIFGFLFMNLIGYTLMRLDKKYAKEDKPKVAIGDSKDLTYIIRQAGNGLRNKQMLDEADELEERAENAKTFEKAMKIINQYVEFVAEDELEEEEEFE